MGLAARALSARAPQGASAIRHWLLFAAGASVLGALLACYVYFLHASIGELERERLTFQGRVIDENLAAQLAAINLVLESVRSDLPFLRASRDGLATANRGLKAVSKAMPGMPTLLLLDADGKAAASSREELIGQSFRDRDYFKAARQHGGSEPQVHPSSLMESGTNSITLTLVLRDEKGAFAGLVGAMLPSAHFQTLLKSVLYKSDMRAVLVHVDGLFIARAPYNSDMTAARVMPASSRAYLAEHLSNARKVSVFERRIAPTGEERLTVFRTLQLGAGVMDGPLVIAVSRDRAAIYADWRRDAMLRAAVFLVVLLASALGLQSWRKRHLALLRSEAERRLGEDQLRLFFDQDLVGLTITSPQKGWIRINACLCRMLEYSEQELRAMTWVELTHADDLAADEEQFARMASGQIDGYRLEKRFIARTGRIVPTELVVRCVRKPSGELELVTAMVQDISDRSDAQRRLVASQERYRAMVDWTPEPIIVHTDAIINYANAAAVAMFGAGTEQDLIGRNVLEFVHPDFHAIVRERAKNMTESAVHSPMIEEKLIRLDGKLIDVEVHSTSVGSTGTTVHVAMRDITERKQRDAELRESERRWKLALESAGDGMWDWNLQSNEQYFRPA